MQYLYPIASLADDSMLVMHQKSLDDLELWIFNPEQNLAIKELGSMFLPTNIQVLPNKKSYSFIDRGRIRIKSFNKRAPRSIDIFEPIGAIVSMTWINDFQFYFVGKHEDLFNVFLCNIAENDIAIYCLNDFCSNLNYLYPYKMNDFLFCVTKDSCEQYAIYQIPWDPKLYKDALQFSMQTRQKPSPQSNLTPIITSQNPLCFLHMQDEQTGFVLQLNGSVDANSLSFSCCELQQDGHGWKLIELFEFCLPQSILIGSDDTRLHESIYPFLPIYTTDWIYFTTKQSPSSTCQIQCYNRTTRIIEPIIDTARSWPAAHDFFAPCIINNRLYSGISQEVSEKKGLVCCNQTTGISTCRLPSVQL
jgi:hypothetical protein